MCFFVILISYPLLNKRNFEDKALEKRTWPTMSQMLEKNAFYFPDRRLVLFDVFIHGAS